MSLPFSTRRLPVLALLTLVFALAGVGQSWAGNRYVRSGASGAGTGANWTDALTALPGELIPGETYYVASGNYGGQYVSRTIANTTMIYVRKATVADHGTSTGWSDSYATGQAVWSVPSGATPPWTTCWNIATGYIEFDGVTGSGTSGHGFKIVGYQGIPAVVKVNNGYTANSLTFKHVEMSATSYGGGSATRIFWNAANSFSDHTFQYCYFHDAGASWVSESTGANWLAEYCTFARCGSANPAQHCAGIVFGGIQNATLRYCVLQDMLQNGSTTFIEPQGSGAGGLYIYGNVFQDTLPSSGCSQGIFAITASDVMTGVQILNNTIYGLHSNQPGVWGGNVAGSTLTVRNNVWQNCDVTPAMGGSGTFTTSNNILNTGEVAFRGPSTGDFQLSANTSSGMTLSSPYDTDPAGTARVPGSWSIGAYQYTPLVGNPGTVNLSSNVYSISEAAGFITIPVLRVGGSTGAASVQYATSDGTAYAGTNYTATSGTLNWSGGDSTTKSFNVPVLDLDVYGYPTFNITLSSATGASLGAPSTAVVTILGTGSPPVSLLPWPATWKATNGVISAPFISSGGYLFQTDTTDIADGGTANFTFVAPSDMYASVTVKVNAPQLYQNSAGFDFNNIVQTHPDNTCQFNPVTDGFEDRDVGWQGSLSPEATPPTKVWFIPAGTNTLTVRGREGMTQFDEITVVKLVTNTISSVSTTQTNGWYKAGVVIPISVNLPVAGTVTGTPLLNLNVYTNAIYASGSGTTNLIFNYTVASGQSTVQLDNLSTNSLSLNGGTLKDSNGVDFLLPLPAPGTSGSLGFGRSIVVDTTPPSTLIGEPSTTLSDHIDVTFPVTFVDDYFNYSTLNSSDVTLTVVSGSVAGTVSVSGVFNVFYVTIGSITGTGSFYISIAPGAGVDLAGNLATGAGPSTSVNVISPTNGQARVVSTTAGTVIGK